MYMSAGGQFLILLFLRDCFSHIGSFTAFIQICVRGFIMRKKQKSQTNTWLSNSAKFSFYSIVLISMKRVQTYILTYSIIAFVQYELYTLLYK